MLNHSEPAWICPPSQLASGGIVPPSEAVFQSCAWSWSNTAGPGGSDTYELSGRIMDSVMETYGIELKREENVS